MNEIKQTNTKGLEGYAEAILERIDRFGAVLDHPEGESLSRRIGHANAALSVHGVQEYLESEKVARQSVTQVAAEGAAFTRGILRVTKFLASLGGSFLEGTTGVMNMARQFHRDREAGDLSYAGTMKAMARSVAQISGGQAVGWLTGSAVAAVTATTVTPDIIGAAVGLGAQYLIGKALGDRG
jgi:hypothetical protein